MTSLSRSLASAALAGAATGARSFTGLAALALAARRDAGPQPDRTLARPWVKAAASALAAQECVLDKLPAAPSRLKLPGLASRLAGAAASGTVIARRASRDQVRPDDLPDVPGVPGPPGIPDPGAAAEPEPLVTARLAACLLAAVGAAAATAWAGPRWRSWASGRFGRDWIGAGLEDAAAVALAAAAALLG
jgi:uncharacterized membrane protein